MEKWIQMCAELTGVDDEQKKTESDGRMKRGERTQEQRQPQFGSKARQCVFIEEEKELENGRSNSWIKGERKKHSWKRTKEGKKSCEEDEDERVQSGWRLSTPPDHRPKSRS